MEAIGAHIVNQVLRAITVIAHFKHVYFVFFFQHDEPIIHVLIVNVIFAGKRYNTLLHKKGIRHAVDCRCPLDAVCGHEELCKRIQLPAPLHDHRCRRQVRCLRKVNAAHGIGFPEVCKCDFCRRTFYNVRVKPCNRRILLDIAILRQEFGLFACGHFRNRYFLAEEVFRHGNAHIRVCLFQLFNIVPAFHIVNHV